MTAFCGGVFATIVGSLIMLGIQSNMDGDEFDIPFILIMGYGATLLIMFGIYIGTSFSA